MGHDKILRTDGNVSRVGAENAKSYDAWASSYDRELANWGYEAPEQAAGLMKGHLKGFETARILDCGCGTGMTGAALREAGAGGELIGFDASRSSLETAREKKIYDRLEQADLNERLALADDSVDGILCIGVLTYLEEESIFREWLRILRPGGVVVFTSRDDFWHSRGIAAMLERLEAAGRWTALHVSPPMPYLPGHPEFANKVKAIYGVYRKAERQGT